jgi:4a-hydroxytetrahydrobiopterin dehydratase
MSNEDLSRQKCEACDSQTPALDRHDAARFKAQLNEGWEFNEDHREIRRAFKFKNFYHTIEFVNAVAWIANREGHHPDLEVGYNRCLVRFSTHAIGGLSRNDFICAAKVDDLFR